MIMANLFDHIGRGWAYPPQLNDRNRISTVTDDLEIRQALYIIINTYPGERIMRPEFGCYIQDLVFMPANQQTAVVAERYVREAVTRWEPRIELREVKVTPGNHERGELVIELEYQIKQENDVRSMVYPYYLVPDQTIGEQPNGNQLPAKS
jgi:uncharacterized protein